MDTTAYLTTGVIYSRKFFVTLATGVGALGMLKNAMSSEAIFLVVCDPSMNEL